MARIRQYEPSDRQLHPSESGFAAFETAGRRIGPLFQQIGRDISEQGVLKRQQIEDMARWPFELLDLKDRQQKAAEARAGGLRFGGVDEGRSSGGFRTPRSYRPFNEVNMGAPFMSRFARNLVSGEPSEETVNQPVSGDYTLSQGRFVKYNPFDQRDPNQDAIDAARQWYNDPSAIPPDTKAWLSGQPVSTTAPVPQYDTRGDFSGRDPGYQTPAEQAPNQPADSSSGGWWSTATDALSSMFSSGTPAPADSGGDTSSFTPSTTSYDPGAMLE